MAKIIQGITVIISDNDAAGNVTVLTNHSYSPDGDIVPVVIKQGDESVWMDKDTALAVAYAILDEAGVGHTPGEREGSL